MAESLRTIDFPGSVRQPGAPLRPVPPPLRPPEDPHLLYLRTHLETVCQQGAASHGPRRPDPPVVGIDRDRFWELIGLRVQGCPRTLLAATAFQRQDRGSEGYRRRSLAHFLSAPPAEIPRGRVVYPPNMLELAVPESAETVPAFLQRLRAGRGAAAMLVDTGLIEFAFDLRPANPSSEVSRVIQIQDPVVLAFRTTSGHVLSGLSQGLSTKLRQPRPFFGLTEVWQHTARGTFLLPTLILHRGFLAMMAEIPLEPGRSARPLLHPAFSLDAANPSHLFDPRL